MRVNPAGNAGGYGQGPAADRAERADRDGKRRQQQGSQQDQPGPRSQAEHDEVELHEEPRARESMKSTQQGGIPLPTPPSSLGSSGSTVPPTGPSLDLSA
jgi:hypothetical protein